MTFGLLPGRNGTRKSHVSTQQRQREQEVIFVVNEAPLKYLLEAEQELDRPD